MGCVQSESVGPSIGTQPRLDAPLKLWTAEEVETFISQNQTLEPYACTCLKGTVGAVFAVVNDQTLQDAGIANSLHRLQLLHLRDVVLARQNSKRYIPEPIQKSDKNEEDGIQNASSLKITTKIMPPLPESSISSVVSPLTATSDIGFSERLQKRQSVDVEEGRYMAMMKVLPSGSLIRVVGETLPLDTNSIASCVVRLHKLHSAALYNTDNCRKFVKRCCQIQTIFTSKHLRKAIHDMTIVNALEEVLEDALNFFPSFSQRGWLRRTLHSPRDKQTFQELDNRLTQPCLNTTFLEISDTSVANLRQMPVYTNATKQLTKTLLDAGGMEGLRQSPSAVDQIKAHFPEEKRSQLDDAIKEDIGDYELQIDAHGPHTILRHHTLRAFWRKHFAHRERITWDEFWNTFPLILKTDECPTLNEMLKRPQNRELVQLHLTRAMPQLLSMTEVDFAFALDISIEESLHRIFAISTQLSVMTHQSKGSSSLSQDDNLILQSHAFNYPLLKEDVMERSELFQNLQLGVQDCATKIIELSGRPGIGKAVFANRFGRHLLSIGHWTESYWIDLSGTSSHTAAGHQIMYGMGCIHESIDASISSGFLQRRPGAIGIILVGSESLLNGTEDQTRFVDHLTKLLDAAQHIQIVIPTHVSLKESRHDIRRYAVEELTAEQCRGWMCDRFKKTISAENRSRLSECLSDVTSPLCLDIFSGMIKMGDLTVGQFLMVFHHEFLETCTDSVTHPVLVSLSRTELKCDRQLIAVSEMVGVGVGPFTEGVILELLSSSGELTMTLRSNLRKLQRRNILSFNTAMGQMSLHSIIREALRHLNTHLKLDQRRARRAFLEVVYGKCIWTAQHMMQSGTCFLGAVHSVHRDATSIYQLMNWASAEDADLNMDIFQKVMWEAFPSLSSCLDVNSIEKFYKSCSAMAEKSGNVAFKVQCMIQVGGMLRDIGRIQDSENVLRDALAVCLIQLKECPLEMASCQEGIGMSCIRLRKMFGAIDAYERACDIYKGLRGERSVEVARCCSALGTAYGLAKRHEAALRCYSEALEIRKHVHGSEHFFVANALSTVGKQLSLMHRYEEAKQSYKQALEILERALGPDHPEVADVLVMFAELLRSKKTPAAAEPLLLKALQIRESSYGSLHTGTIECLSSLAILYKGLYRFEDAIRFATRELELRERFSGTNAAEVTTTLMTLSTVYCDAGDYVNAHKHCKTALVSRERQSGTANLAIAQSCAAMGLILKHLGKFNEGLVIMERSLRIRLKHFGKRDRPEIGASLNGLAEIEKELHKSPPIFTRVSRAIAFMIGRWDEAEEHCREGLEIRRRLLSKDHLSISLSLQTLATILVSSGDRLEAETHIRQSIAIREKFFGIKSYPVMQGYDILASILAKQGRLDDAIERAHISVDIKCKSLAKNHPEVARSLMVLGDILRLQSKDGAAKQKFQRALSIYTLAFGESHPVVDEAKHRLNESMH